MSVVEASTPTVRKTALNAVHRQMGAKMVDFNGWDMPVEYPATGGLIAEHMAVRTGVGIFDVSHMGDIRLVGPQAFAAVQHVSMNDASQLATGQAQYSALLYPQGTFVDDECRILDDSAATGWSRTEEGLKVLPAPDGPATRTP